MFSAAEARQIIEQVEQEMGMPGLGAGLTDQEAIQEATKLVANYPQLQDTLTAGPGPGLSSGGGQAMFDAARRPAPPVGPGVSFQGEPAPDTGGPGRSFQDLPALGSRREPTIQRDDRRPPAAPGQTEVATPPATGPSTVDLMTPSRAWNLALVENATKKDLNKISQTYNDFAQQRGDADYARVYADGDRARVRAADAAFQMEFQKSGDEAAAYRASSNTYALMPDPTDAAIGAKDKIEREFAQRETGFRGNITASGGGGDGTAAARLVFEKEQAGIRNEQWEREFQAASTGYLGGGEPTFAREKEERGQAEREAQRQDMLKGRREAHFKSQYDQLMAAGQHFAPAGTNYAGSDIPGVAAPSAELMYRAYGGEVPMGYGPEIPGRIPGPPVGA